LDSFTRREFALIGTSLRQSARIPIVRLKTCISLFEVHTDSSFSTKLMVEKDVDPWSSVACEFKRAGFLEGEAIGTSLPIAQFTGASISPTRQWACLIR
jgi:hypothetical protein